jgi:hypothetical protein
MSVIFSHSSNSSSIKLRNSPSVTLFISGCLAVILADAIFHICSGVGFPLFSNHALYFPPKAASAKSNHLFVLELYEEDAIKLLVLLCVFVRDLRFEDLRFEDLRFEDLRDLRFEDLRFEDLRFEDL